MCFSRLEVANRRGLIEECGRIVGGWVREQTLGYVEGRCWRRGLAGGQEEVPHSDPIPGLL